MELSIKAAAQLANVSRTTIYKKIESGELSRSSNGTVDTVDVLRVFSGSSPVQRSAHRSAQVTHIKQVQNELETPQNSTLEAEFLREKIRLLEANLSDAKARELEAKEREQWLQTQVSALTDTMKLLEAPKQPFTTPPNLPEAEKRGFFGFRKK